MCEKSYYEKIGPIFVRFSISKKSKIAPLTEGVAHYVECLLGNNLKRIKDFRAVWVCRTLACIGLYILFWSIPVCFWLAVILWIFSGKIELVNYVIGIKPEFIDTLVPFDQRKTILITGGSSTKG